MKSIHKLLMTERSRSASSSELRDSSSAEESNEKKEDSTYNKQLSQSDGSHGTLATTAASTTPPSDNEINTARNTNRRKKGEKFTQNSEYQTPGSVRSEEDDRAPFYTKESAAYQNSSLRMPLPTAGKVADVPVKILLIFQNHARNDFKQFHVSITTEMRKCFDRYCSLTKQSSSSLLFFAAKRDGKRNLHHISGTQTSQSLSLQNLDVITAFPKYVNLKFAHAGSSSSSSSFTSEHCSSVFRLRLSCTTTILDAYESYAHCVQSSLKGLEFHLYRSEGDEAPLHIHKYDTPVSLYLPDDHIILVRSVRPSRKIKTQFLFENNKSIFFFVSSTDKNLSPVKRKESGKNAPRSCFHCSQVVFLLSIIVVLCISLLDIQSKLQEQLAHLSADLHEKGEVIHSLHVSNLTCFNELSSATAKIKELQAELNKRRKSQPNSSSHNNNNNNNNKNNSNSSQENPKSDSNSFGSKFFKDIHFFLKSAFSRSGADRGKSGGPQKCRFSSANKVLEAMRQDSDWLQLQMMDYRDPSRKKLRRALSRKYHPDAMMKMGCPSDYGNLAMHELNKLRV